MKYIVLAFSALMVALDQYFKHLAIVHLSQLDDLTYPIIKDVFHLTYTENRGAAFGMMQGKQFFLIGVTGAIILAGIVLILMNKVKSKFLMWTLALIIGGGIGNLIDRIFRHFVVDYLDLRIINFAVFNFADCCVVVGTILLVIYVLFFDNEFKKENKKEEIEIKQETKEENDEVISEINE